MDVDQDKKQTFWHMHLCQHAEVCIGTITEDQYARPRLGTNTHASTSSSRVSSRITHTHNAIRNGMSRVSSLLTSLHIGRCVPEHGLACQHVKGSAVFTARKTTAPEYV